MKKIKKQITRKNIKKIKGGTIHPPEKLMDDNFIITNLYNSFNDRPIKYNFDVVTDGKFFNIIINDNDYNLISKYNPDNEPCLTLQFKNVSNKVTIYIDILNKCAPINNYGKIMLEILKNFALTYGYYSIIIGSDVSYLDFYIENKEVIIDLANLHILTYGESWYNKLGFYNPLNKKEIINNIFIISNPILDIDKPDEIIDLIDRNRNYYVKNSRKIPICYSHIISSYGDFRKLLEYILDLTNTSQEENIEYVFKSLYKYIYNNCDTNDKTCYVDYITIQKISCFIDFVYELLDIKYTKTNLEHIIIRNYASNQSSGKKINKTKMKRKIRK